jgi:YVTN family beta-propeller protein
MRWKIASFILLTTLVGVIWGTWVYPKLPISSVQAQSVTTIGKARIGVAPRIISFQGLLKDSSTGDPVSNGSQQAIFRLYTSESGGSTVWSETQTITTRNGVFSTILGRQYPINPSVVAVPELWLGVRLPPDAEMTPRQRIAGSVYSVGATEAQVAGTTGVTARQIALRKWYKADRVRGPRIDVEMLAVDDAVWNASTTEASMSLDVTAITSEEVGRITFNWGNFLSQNINPSSTNRGGFVSASNFSRSCNELRALNRYKVCLTSSELVIIPDAMGSNSAGEQLLSCPGCKGMAFDGLNIWASSSDTDQVYKIDLTREYSEQLTELCPGSLCHPNPKALSITATVSVGNNPQGTEFDGERVWVANQDSDTVTVIDASDSSVLATVSVGDAPTKVLFDGQSIWVLNTGDETVTQIDSSTRSVVGTYSVGSSPTALSFDGSAIWVANSGDDTVTLLRHTDGSLIETISVSGAPHLLQFDGVGTWIASKDNLPDMQAKTVLISGERWILTRY